MSPKANLVMVVSRGAGEQDSGQLGLHLGISQIRSPFFGHNDNVPRWQDLLVASKKLSQEALDPVAPEGFAHLATRYQPQPRAFSLPGGQADAEMRRVQFSSLCLSPEILPAAAEPLVLGKAGRPGGCNNVTGDVSLAGGLEGVLQRGSLYLTPRGASGPWPGGAVIFGARPWCASGPGSRGCESGAVYSAEKCVSLRFFLGDNFTYKPFINHFSGILSRTRKSKLRELSNSGGQPRPPGPSLIFLAGNGCLQSPMNPSILDIFRVKI